ncbi:MAG: sorbosone dehydrogenase family protein [Calditrichia bacterium]
MKKYIFLIVCFSSLIFGQSDLAERLPFIHMPDGFSIELYYSGITNARSLCNVGDSVIFVGTRKAGNVYAVLDTNLDHKGDSLVILASGLNQPNGVAFRNGNLYVAEINRILVFENIMEQLSPEAKYRVVKDDLPTETHHGWKYIAFGPDDKLYVPVGAPCNVCLEENPIFATICRMNPDGTGFEIFAHGVRNTVGFDWHPQTGHLWFTDNGRDWMGDDLPPDELNVAPEPGLHFGFPFCHGGIIADPEYGNRENCNKFVKPVQNLGPHVAALGCEFYTGKMFPPQYYNQIFIAEHGSWNRSKKIGYRVTIVTLEDNIAVSYDPFATGWLQDEKVWGRPVDIEQLSDGSLILSDDYAHAIYRITYNRPLK